MDERLENLGGGGYFKELLERIRDIRASEKSVLFVRFWKSMQPASTMTRKQKSPSISSKKSRIKFIMPSTDRLPQKSFTTVPMPRRSLWD